MARSSEGVIRTKGELYDYLREKEDSITQEYRVVYLKSKATSPLLSQ